MLHLDVHCNLLEHDARGKARVPAARAANVYRDTHVDADAYGDGARRFAEPPYFLTAEPAPGRDRLA